MAQGQMGRTLDMMGEVVVSYGLSERRVGGDLRRQGTTLSRVTWTVPSPSSCPSTPRPRPPLASGLATRWVPHWTVSYGPSNCKVLRLIETSTRPGDYSVSVTDSHSEGSLELLYEALEHSGRFRPDDVFTVVTHAASISVTNSQSRVRETFYRLTHNRKVKTDPRQRV